MNCPNCQSSIPIINANIKEGIAKCDNCDNIFKIKEALETKTITNFDINNCPDGTWFRKERNTTIIGATTKSPIAYFLVPFMLIWSGLSVGGIYGSQIVSGKFNLMMSLFGIPFLIGSIIFWSLALMAIWGKVELIVDRKGGTIFTGIGNIGLSKKFNWDDITSITETSTNLRKPGSNGTVLSLEGQKRITFGSGLNDSRKYYMLSATKQIIHNYKTNRLLV